MTSNYPKAELPPSDTYGIYEVYVDSGRAEELFREFCSSLGPSIEISWRDTGDV